MSCFFFRTNFILMKYFSLSLATGDFSLVTTVHIKCTQHFIKNIIIIKLLLYFVDQSFILIIKVQFLFLFFFICPDWRWCHKVRSSSWRSHSFRDWWGKWVTHQWSASRFPLHYKVYEDGLMCRQFLRTSKRNWVRRVTESSPVPQDQALFLMIKRWF